MGKIEAFVENKTLVITDPCYMTDDCDDFETAYSPLICRSTIYGDWSCFVFRGNEEDAEEGLELWNEVQRGIFDDLNKQGYNYKGALGKMYDLAKKTFIKEHCFGEFCADAGMVAVYDMDNLPEDKKQFCKDYPWCACVIENYTGPVSYIIDDNDQAHIVGNGFYSAQSGF